MRTLLALAIVALLGTARTARATPPSTMAPLDEYLIADRDAEVAFARSAAPPSIRTTRPSRC